MRTRLAIYLHEKHPRTCAAVKARAMLEPDSLGVRAQSEFGIRWNTVMHKLH